MTRDGFQRCRWTGQTAQCRVTGTIDGLCAFHYDCTRVPQLNTRDSFSEWRADKIDAGDTRWALYSEPDFWALLDGESRPHPRCMLCRDPLPEQRVFSVRDIHRDGTVVCLRCGPHPKVIAEWAETPEKAAS